MTSHLEVRTTNDDTFEVSADQAQDFFNDLMNGKRYIRFKEHGNPILLKRKAIVSVETITYGERK